MNEKVNRKLRDFPWGIIKEVHEIAEYVIVEYLESRPGNAPRGWKASTLFHTYVGEEDTNISVQSLDAALILAIAFKHENGNRMSQAAHYFARMIGLNEKA